MSISYKLYLRPSSTRIKTRRKFCAAVFNEKISPDGCIYYLERIILTLWMRKIILNLSMQHIWGDCFVEDFLRRIGG